MSSDRYEPDISLLNKLKKDYSIVKDDDLSIKTQINETNKEIKKMIDYYTPFIFNIFKDKGIKILKIIIIKYNLISSNITDEIYNNFNKDEKTIIRKFIRIIFTYYCYFPLTQFPIETGEIIFDVDKKTINIEYYNEKRIVKNIFNETEEEETLMAENDIIMGEIYNNGLHNIKIKEYDENTKIFKCCYMACEDMMDQELGNVCITKEKFMSDYKKGLRNVT